MIRRLRRQTWWQWSRR